MKALMLPKNKVAIECHPSESGLIRRCIIGVRWNSTRRYWYANLSRKVADAVRKLPGIELPQELVDYVPPVIAHRPFPPHYATKTRPYIHQLSGMAHLYRTDRAAIVSEPGTGKTKMAIDAASAMYLDGLVGSVFIACPVGVRNTWKHEFGVHCPVPYNIQMITGDKDPDAPLPGVLNVAIVGIESLAVGRAFSRSANFMLNAARPVIIVDEAHLIKNHSASRTKNVKTLSMNCKYRWFLTGTPVANHIGDLYSLFDYLDPDIIGFPDYWTFMQRYAIYGGYENRQIIGWQHTEEILEAVEPYMFKALKKDCLDLPPKVYITREVKMSTQQSSIYKNLKKDKAVGNLTTKGSLDLALRLHQIAGGWSANMNSVGESIGMLPIVTTPPKVSEVLDILEECSDQSVVIWCVYRHEVDALVRAIGNSIGKDKVVEITGGVSESGRWEAVKAIQSGDARVMIGTAASGGVGITLTAASVVIYFSNSFKYTDRVQSEDRCHRAGQKKSVTIIDLVAPGTVDENIIQALSVKCDLSDWIMKGGSI